MEEIIKAFSEMTKDQTYTQIARTSGISRNTIYNVRKNPERVTLRVLRKIISAMGYHLIIKLEKVQ
jgi:DNA-binding phage protein